MANKKRKPPEETKDDFIVLFTALSLIILAFFIMLNSIATLDTARTKAAIDSLTETFGPMSVLPGHKMQSSRESKSFKGHRYIEELIRQKGISDVEVIEDEHGRVIVRISADVLFASAGIQLSPKFFPSLNGLAELIGEVGHPVRVEGHADPTPSSGQLSNWYYSAARASAVQRYLEMSGSLPPGMVKVAGYGDTRPIPDVPLENADAHRRVEVVFPLIREK